MADEKWFGVERADPIEVGDVWDWQPHGTEGWPRSSSMGLVVTRITYPEKVGDGWEYDELKTTADLCADDDPSLVRIWVKGRNDKECWNELPHFRDMARRAKE